MASGLPYRKRHERIFYSLFGRLGKVIGRKVVLQESKGSASPAKPDREGIERNAQYLTS